PTSQVSIDGGPGVDTLLFDAAGFPIVPSEPAIPNGTIQVNGLSYGAVNYKNIEDIPGFSGAIANPHGPYSIVEGNNLTLSGSATPATNSTILGYAWDLNGDGSFGDTTGTSPTLTWTQLEGLGLDRPGTHTIALRVNSDTNTVNSYSTLTILPAAPSLTV